jgi:hypothetical protein
MPTSAAASLRAPGTILLVSCYELGHQPHGVAMPAAFLARAGFAPAALDLSVEGLDAAKVARARLICISVPMHTALRLGMRAAAEMRALNPSAHICFHGLYAALNAEWLLAHGGDSAIGGEAEQALVELAEALELGQPPDVPGVSVRGRPAAPRLERLEFLPPVRAALPALDRYARLEREGRHLSVGYVEATRGCRHLCLHCPIPPVYHGRIFAVPVETVMADVRRQVVMGAAHITFGDPDFLNAPAHALRVARGLHGEFPALTFDFTAKIEHVLEHRALFPELVSLGALFMVSAVESLSNAVLAEARQGSHPRRRVRGVRDPRAAGSHSGRLVSFTPGPRSGLPRRARGGGAGGFDRPRGSGPVHDPAAHPARLATARARVRPAVSGRVRSRLVRVSVAPSRPAHGPSPSDGRGRGRSGDARERGCARYVRSRARAGSGGGRSRVAGSSRRRGRWGAPSGSTAAGAAAHRALVLLSRTQRGPVRSSRVGDGAGGLDGPWRAAGRAPNMIR